MTIPATLFAFAVLMPFVTLFIWRYMVVLYPAPMEVIEATLEPGTDTQPITIIPSYVVVVKAGSRVPVARPEVVEKPEKVILELTDGSE